MAAGASAGRSTQMSSISPAHGFTEIPDGARCSSSSRSACALTDSGSMPTTLPVGRLALSHAVSSGVSGFPSLKTTMAVPAVSVSARMW